MLDERMSQPRHPIFVMEVESNEFILKNAFVRVSNDLYVFVVIVKSRHEVSNTLLNHLSLRVVIEEDCIWCGMAFVVNHLVARSRLSDIFRRHRTLRNPLGVLDQRGFLEKNFRGFLDLKRGFLDLKRGFLLGLPSDRLMSH